MSLLSTERRLTGQQFLTVDLSPTYLNTGTTNDTFQQSGKQLLEGIAGKEGVTFFRGLQVLHKNKLKSDIFNDKKKFMNKNIFLCHN